MHTAKASYFYPASPGLLSPLTLGSQTLQPTSAPPSVQPEHSRITELQSKEGRMSLTHFYPPKIFVDGKPIFQSLLYLYKRAYMKPGASITYEYGSTEVFAEIAFAVDKFSDADHIVKQDIWDLFRMLVAYAMGANAHHLVTGFVWPSVMVANSAIEHLRSTKSFKDLYLKVGTSITASYFVEGSIQPWAFNIRQIRKSMLVKFLVDEVSILIDDVQQSLLSELRAFTACALINRPIGGIVIGDPTIRGPKHIRTKATDILALIGNNTGGMEKIGQASILYTNPIIEDIMSKLIHLVGIEIMARAMLERDTANIFRLPLCMLSLAATLVTTELLVLENISKHGGQRMLPINTMYRVTPEEQNILTGHREILQALEVSTIEQRTGIVLMVRRIEEGIDVPVVLKY